MRETLGSWFPKTFSRLAIILNWLKAFLFDFELGRDHINLYDYVVDFYIGAIEYNLSLLWESLNFVQIPTILQDALELQLLELHWYLLFLGLYSDLSGGRNSVKSENSPSNFLRFVNRFLRFCQKLE